MEELKKILQENNLQITKQRLEVLRVLKDLNTHITIEDVLKELKKRNINLTVATAYNVLNIFEKHNIIMKLNAIGEPIIYDVNTYNHIHVYDSDTREVKDYDNNELIGIINDYFEKHPMEGIKLKRIDLSIIGNIKH